MVYMIGKYNVDFAGLIYNGNIPYDMVIISEFDGNTELKRKTFYFRANMEREYTYAKPLFRTEADIERYFKSRNNARFCVFRWLQVKVYINPLMFTECAV